MNVNEIAANVEDLIVKVKILENKVLQLQSIINNLSNKN